MKLQRNNLYLIFYRSLQAYSNIFEDQIVDPCSILLRNFVKIFEDPGKNSKVPLSS